MLGRSRLGAGAVVLAAAGLATGGVTARADDSPPRAHAAAGGVSLTPDTVAHAARNGTLGTITVKNTTSEILQVTIRVRPWLQNRLTGTVSANLKTSLSSYFTASSTSFNLSPGSRPVRIIQRRTPPGGSSYSAIEVFAKQRKPKAINGVIPQYRVVGRLRANPVRKRVSLRAGTIGFVGRGSGRQLVLPIRNTGNTLDPIGGSVAIKGPTSKTNTVKPLGIIPGQVVNLVGGSLKGFKPGNYTAVWSITQGSKRYTARRTFRL